LGWVDDQVCRSASGGSFNVGVDTGRSVDGRDYQVPFRFTGEIYKLTARLGPEELSPAEREMIYGTLRAKQ